MLDFTNKFTIDYKLIKKVSVQNVSFKTGMINGITVLNLDTRDSVEWFESNIAKICDLNCHVVNTPRSGVHLYFEYSENFTMNKIMNIDILNNNNNVFYGKGYTLVKFSDSLEMVPEKLLEFC